MNPKILPMPSPEVEQTSKLIDEFRLEGAPAGELVPLAGIAALFQAQKKLSTTVDNLTAEVAVLALTVSRAANALESLAHTAHAALETFTDPLRLVTLSRQMERIDENLDAADASRPIFNESTGELCS